MTASKILLSLIVITITMILAGNVEYAYSADLFSEYQAIPTKGAHDWESFNINGESYFAVANTNSNSGSRNIDSIIYKWNGTSFVEFQAIPTMGASGWEDFTIDGATYLALTNARDGEDVEIESKIYYQTDPNATHEIIEFSGYKWHVKHNYPPSEPVAPDDNYWSNRKSDVWADDEGLHLKIVKGDDGNYYCTEVWTDKVFGYGTYIFYLNGDMDDTISDKNIVLGFFTYDENACVTNTNTEIDIEFSKWGKKDNILNYSVQPTPDSGGVAADEYPDGCSKRNNQTNNNIIEMVLSGLYSTHGFKWTPNFVLFNSYHGHGYPTDSPIGFWEYNIKDANCKICCIKENDGQTCNTWSVPIGIPKRTNNNRVHINFWLFKHSKPLNENGYHIIIKKFEYVPLSVASIP